MLHPRRLVHPRRTSAIAALAVSTALAGCGSASRANSSAAAANGTGTVKPVSGAVVAVGAENEYANVISQIGGPYVKVSSILNNPNTDPHTFTSSPSVAQTVSAAKLIVQNGVGYDDFMTQIEHASNSSAKVITVQRLLGLPTDTPNPHLWYSPRTMPLVAKAVASDLAALEPSHASYFRHRASAFVTSLQPWFNAIAAFKRSYPNTAVATTEPVGDYMLQAAGTANMTPFTLQAAIMNGTDPAPQNVTLQNGLFSQHKVKVFVYNQQVTDTLTNSFKALARKNGVPIVGVYETMPVPGYDYQTWMLAEVNALRKAVADKTSTVSLIR